MERRVHGLSETAQLLVTHPSVVWSPCKGVPMGPAYERWCQKQEKLTWQTCEARRDLSHDITSNSSCSRRDIKGERYGETFRHRLNYAKTVKLYHPYTQFLFFLIIAPYKYSYLRTYTDEFLKLLYDAERDLLIIAKFLVGATMSTKIQIRNDLLRVEWDVNFKPCSFTLTPFERNNKQIPFQKPEIHKKKLSYCWDNSRYGKNSRRLADPDRNFEYDLLRFYLIETGFVPPPPRNSGAVIRWSAMPPNYPSHKNRTFYHHHTEIITEVDVQLSKWHITILKRYIENELKQNKFLKKIMTRPWDRTANLNAAGERFPTAPAGNSVLV